MQLGKKMSQPGTEESVMGLKGKRLFFFNFSQHVNS